MPYLTLQSRLEAAAARADHLNTLTLADLDVVHTVLTRLPVQCPDDSVRRLYYAPLVEVHKAIHARTLNVCCGDMGVTVATESGPLACLGYDVFTATDLTALTDLVDAARPARPTDSPTEVTRNTNHRQLLSALRWTAISAATVGYTRGLEDVSRAVELFSGLPSPARQAALALATRSWAGTLDDLHTAVTAVTAN